MPHSSSDSATTFSAFSSVEAYQEPKLQNQISALRTSSVTSDNLAQRAEGHVARFATHKKHIFTYDDVAADLAKILSAMLFYAEEAGGDPSCRYVAAAIIASTTIDRGEDWAGRLRDLGVTWLTHLLYNFKSDESHNTSKTVTPALQDLDDAIGHDSMNPSFRDKLLLRDGFQCAITGCQDLSHPSPKDLFNTLHLQAAHILPQAIGDFDTDHTSPSSASATFDIFVNFTGLQIESPEALAQHIDDPANGMMLQHDAHVGFENLHWCLKRVGMDTYQLQIVGPFPCLIARGDKNAAVVFRDRSSEFSHGPIPTPNPKFIAIHAAIARVVHTSGAAKFFDELLGKYQDPDDPVPLLRWMDVEAFIATEKTRELLAFELSL